MPSTMASAFDLFQHWPESVKNDPKLLQFYRDKVENQRRKLIERDMKRGSIEDMAHGSDSNDNNKKLKAAMIDDANTVVNSEDRRAFMNGKVPNMKNWQIHASSKDDDNNNTKRDTMIDFMNRMFKADKEEAWISSGASSSSIEKPSPDKKKEEREHYSVPPVNPLLETVEKMNSIARKMGGTTPVLFYSKAVTKSDLDPYQNRLLLTDKGKNPIRENLNGLLTPREQNLLIKKQKPQGTDKKDKSGLPVCLVDGDGNQYKINDVNEHGKLMFAELRFLNSNQGFRIVGSNYTEFVKKYGLKYKMDVIRVYIFHVNDRNGGDPQVWIGLIKEPMPSELIRDRPVQQQQQEVNNNNNVLALWEPEKNENYYSSEQSEEQQFTTAEGSDQRNYVDSSEQIGDEDGIDLSLSLGPPSARAADGSGSNARPTLATPLKMVVPNGIDLTLSL